MSDDRPTKADYDRFYDRVQSSIESVGRSIIGVMPTKDQPIIPFGYTVGNTLKELPEVLCIGIAESDMFNIWSEIMIRRGKPFEDGELVDVGGKFPCLAVVADDPRTKEDYTCQCEGFFGSQDYDVIQMVVPDLEGRLFSDKDPYKDIPCLSSREAEFRERFQAPLEAKERQQYYPPEAD